MIEVKVKVFDALEDRKKQQAMAVLLAELFNAGWVLVAQCGLGQSVVVTLKREADDETRA